MRRALAFIGVVALSLLTAARSEAAPSIQPGDYLASEHEECTLGFAADGDDGTYFLTAAHCVDHTGETIKLIDGALLGTVAAIGNAASSPTDWALIRVAPDQAAAVSGVVRGRRAPTGVALSTEARLGQSVQYSGYGIPWFIAAPLREQRTGILTGQDQGEWISIGPDTFGDSGGPVLVQASGKALGLVSRVCLGVCTSAGPTIEGILAQAAAAGFPIVLRTS